MCLLFLHSRGDECSFYSELINVHHFPLYCFTYCVLNNFSTHLIKEGIKYDRKWSYQMHKIVLYFWSPMPLPCLNFLLISEWYGILLILWKWRSIFWLLGIEGDIHKVPNFMHNETSQNWGAYKHISLGLGCYNCCCSAHEP